MVSPKIKEVKETTDKKASWIVKTEEIKKTPKFLKRGTKVLVDPNFEPYTRDVEGKYGVRNMWVVNTKEYGLVYVSPLQFVHINEVFNNDYSSAVTVEL